MYSFSTTVSDDFNRVIERVTEALKTEGFGVLTDIDIKATMKAKLDIEHKPYHILGACNPSLAHKALEAEADIGLLLPCNVVVRENDEGTITVSFMDPESVLKLVNRDDIATLAADVRARLQRVKDNI